MTYFSNSVLLNHDVRFYSAFQAWYVSSCYFLCWRTLPICAMYTISDSVQNMEVLSVCLVCADNIYLTSYSVLLYFQLLHNALVTV
jgi:hypothetical protein